MIFPGHPPNLRASPLAPNPLAPPRTIPTHRQGRERAAERLLATERLGQGLARWCTNRKASAFYRIVTGVALVAAEGDVRERARRALREAGEGARRAQKAAVEVLFCLLVAVVRSRQSCCMHVFVPVLWPDVARIRSILSLRMQSSVCVP